MTGDRGGEKVVGRGGGVRRQSRASLTAANELNKFSNAILRFWTGNTLPSGPCIAAGTAVSSSENVRCCLEARRTADRCRLTAQAEGRLGQEDGRRRFARGGEESGETRSRCSSSSEEEEEEVPAASSSSAFGGPLSARVAISTDLRFWRRGKAAPVVSVVSVGATTVCCFRLRACAAASASICNSLAELADHLRLSASYIAACMGGASLRFIEVNAADEEASFGVEGGDGEEG